MTKLKKQNISDLMKIEIPGRPIPLKRHRTNNNKTYDPSKKQKQDFAFQVKSHLPKDFEINSNPIFLTIQFYFPIPKSLSKKKYEEMEGIAHIKKPDLSNLLKFVEDALNGILWKDDSQIFSIVANKHYSHEPKTVIYVY